LLQKRWQSGDSEGYNQRQAALPPSWSDDRFLTSLSASSGDKGEVSKCNEGETAREKKKEGEERERKKYNKPFLFVFYHQFGCNDVFEIERFALAHCR
jgi:hypothetical protein